MDNWHSLDINESSTFDDINNSVKDELHIKNEEFTIKIHHEGSILSGSTIVTDSNLVNDSELTISYIRRLNRRTQDLDLVEALEQCAKDEGHIINYRIGKYIKDVSYLIDRVISKSQSKRGINSKHLRRLMNEINIAPAMGIDRDLDLALVRNKGTLLSCLNNSEMDEEIVNVAYYACVHSALYACMNPLLPLEFRLDLLDNYMQHGNVKKRFWEMMFRLHKFLRHNGCKDRRELDIDEEMNKAIDDCIIEHIDCNSCRYVDTLDTVLILKLLAKCAWYLDYVKDPTKEMIDIAMRNEQFASYYKSGKSDVLL